jgi:hypothetical protein
MLLLCCWIGFQIFPVIPQLSTTQLSLKLAALGRGHVVEPVQAIGAVCDWLAVARLLELARFADGALPAIMLTLPARLFIVGRSVTLPEIFGALCAWILWARWLHRSPLRGALVAWAAAAALLLRGLMPFQWSGTPAPFGWWPFIAFLDSGMVSGAIFLNKTFLYGAAIRLFTAAGHSYRFTAVAISALLGAIEVVQIHLPGRTPEITDPLYALILAVVLALLDRADRPGNKALARECRGERPAHP